MPALNFFEFRRCVEDNPYGKEVVDAFEVAFLLFHLLPDAVNALRAPLHVEFQSFVFQFLLDRSYEALDVFVAARLSLVELVFDHIIGVVLKIFQTEVFQFALQFVESEFMSERGVEIACLLADALFGLDVFRVADLSHQVNPVGYHNKDYAHVLGKGEEQVAEVFAFDNRVFLVKLLDVDESAQDSLHVVAEFVDRAVDFGCFVL